MQSPHTPAPDDAPDPDGAPAELAARLARSPQRLTKVLSAVLDVTASLDLTTTLRNIVGTAAELLDARYAALGVIGTGVDLIEFVHVGVDDRTVAAIGELPHGRGLLGELIEHPVPLLLEDLRDHPSSVGFPAHHPPMTTFIGAPVRVETHVYGNLYLTDKHGGAPFDAEDRLVLEVLAAAAGIAIGNAEAYRSSRRRVRWLQASGEIRSTILAGAPVLGVLDSICAAVAELTDAALTAFVVAEPPAEGTGPNTRTIAAAGRRAELLPAGAAPGARLFELRDRNLVSVDRLAEVVDDVWVRAAEGLGALLAPVDLPDGRTGLLLCARVPGRRPLGEDELPILVAFSDLAALAVETSERHRAQRSLDLSHERERIAEDLHDRVIQRLFATGLSLQAAAARSGAVPADAAGAAVAQLDDAIADLRRSIFDLRHTQPAGPGLRQRLLDLVDVVTGPTGMDVDVHVDPAVDAAVAAGPADQLDAVLREALSNTVRHSRATAVSVAVTIDADLVVVEVVDDGVGVPESGRRSGLRHLVERAERLGGSMKVSTVHPDAVDRPGTRFTWSVPRG